MFDPDPPLIDRAVILQPDLDKSYGPVPSTVMQEWGVANNNYRRSDSMRTVSTAKICIKHIKLDLGTPVAQGVCKDS